MDNDSGAASDAVACEVDDQVVGMGISWVFEKRVGRGMVPAIPHLKRRGTAARRDLIPTVCNLSGSFEIRPLKYAQAP